MKKPLFLAAAVLSMIGFAVTLWLIFYVTPIQGVDVNLSESNPLYFNQKIFYYHVPNAFMLFVAVIICGWGSLKFLRSRDAEWDDVAAASGALAVLFGAMMLITGSIWGKVAWGKWWEWDPRMTSALLLEMTMLGYVLVRKYGGPGSERLSAGLGIFATVNIPLVYFSTKIWNTLHPKSSVVPGLTGSQRGTFWLSVLLFLVIYILLLRLTVDIVRARRRVQESMEEALDGGLL